MQSGRHSVTLAWAPTAAAVGYNIYRGPAENGPFAKMNASPHPKSTFTDASVSGGQTYFYRTTSVNKGGRESNYSNQVRVEIPNS
jgi:fibronectin type 3 domain-containing protein